MHYTMAYILCCVSGAKTKIMLIALNIGLSALNLVLYIAGKKFYDYKKVRPNFRGRFSNNYPLDEEAYRKKKDESLVGLSGETYNGNQNRDKLITILNEFLSHEKIEEALKEYGINLTHQRIGQICKKIRGEKENEIKRSGSSHEEALRSIKKTTRRNSKLE